MYVKEKFGFIGTFELWKRNNKTRKLIKYIKKDNLIMNLALDEIIKCMYNPNADMELKYIGIGDSDAAVAANQTELDNEIFRVPVITKLRTGTGEFYVRAILNAEQPESLSGACTIKEVGTFGGSNAEQWDASSYQTGLMISRIVLTTPESKTDDEEIELKWTYEIARG